MELPFPELLYESLDQLSGRHFLYASKPAVIKGIMLYATLPDRMTLEDQTLWMRMTNTYISGYVGTLNRRHGWRRERGVLDVLASFIFYLLFLSDLGSVDILLWPLCYLFSCLLCYIFMSWLRFARDTGSLSGLLLLGVECLDELNVTKYHYCKSLLIEIQEFAT
jgi:hypothetical protein